MISGGPAIHFAGTGSYAPSTVITNAELALRVDTSDEWIFSRTGIRERRIAGPLESTSHLAAEAGARAIADAGLTAADIDLVIVATITPDMPFPSTACLVQHKLGIRRAVCFDVEAACSGFLYVLDIGASMVASGRYRHALIIGAEKLSSILDWQDRSTCVLFGDGAGAAVLSAWPDTCTGIVGSSLGADGAASEVLYMPGGGSSLPASPQSILDRQHFLKMKGREVFKIAVRVMEQAALDILARFELSPDQITCVIPHQANLRIIEMLSDRLTIPLERFFTNLDRYGNTSAASIPLALDEARRVGRIKPGDTVLLLAFGAGLTWGATLIKWP